MPEILHIDGLTVHHVPARTPARRSVLFVHGYFADATVWDGWLPFFAERGLSAYAVNLRGRAGSRPDVDLGAASIEDFVEDASRVARHIGSVAVVGHSMGGLIAQRLATSDLVSCGVLVAPAPPRGIPILTPRLVVKQLKYLPAIFRSKLLDPDLDDLREIVMNCVPPAQQDMALAMLTPDSGRAARDMSIMGVPVDARRVRCPLLVISAEHDRFIPPHIVARVAARYSAPLQLMRGHAHMMVIEPGWETIADTVARWILEQDAEPVL